MAFNIEKELIFDLSINIHCLFQSNKAIGPDMNLTLLILTNCHLYEYLMLFKINPVDDDCVRVHYGKDKDETKIVSSKVNVEKGRLFIVFYSGIPLEREAFAGEQIA